MENKKKKILYIITKANWGGAQKYVFNLANGLSDFDITVAYGEPFGELETKLKSRNIKTIRISGLTRDIRIWKEFCVFFSLWKIFRNEKPDIIHLNSSKIGGLGAFAGRLAKIKKIIFTAHGWAFNEKRNRLSRTAIKFLSWLTIILSHKTIVLAKKEYGQVINWPFINSKKLAHIYHGVKPIDFLEHTEARKFLKRIIEKLTDVVCPSIDGHPTSVNFSSSFIVGTIAELHKNKGLEYALEVFQKLKFGNNFQEPSLNTAREKLKFFIIGEGEERENLKKSIKDKKLENEVFLLGNIKNASRYLKAFDIFLLSSVKEGLPFALLEAGFAGLPTIATRAGGIPEIIDDMKSGLIVKPGNAEKLAEALKFLIENRHAREKFGIKLKEKIENNFSFEKMFEKTLEIY
ncbi:MAG: glycosyltransferase [Patescibacteria group bacterium]